MTTTLWRRYCDAFHAWAQGPSPAAAAAVITAYRDFMKAYLTGEARARIPDLTRRLESRLAERAPLKPPARKAAE